MPKQKNPLHISKINKRKKTLKKGLLQHLKHFINSHALGYRVAIVLVTIITTTAVYTTQHEGGLFQANLLNDSTEISFDGTSLPIPLTVDYSQGINNHEAHFSDFGHDELSPLPHYHPNELTTSYDQLDWNDSNNRGPDGLINKVLTYSVVYYGGYDDDNTHQEFSGSHNAVDIRALEGTPIASIANGVVLKADPENESGYGHHVVIKHIVPDPDNENEMIPVLSSYSHMSQVDVIEGQVLSKGEIIGEVGSTGFSTTPHIHFQIDRMHAKDNGELIPFAPFFPFSSAEAAEAGYTFTEAVSAGFGMENGLRYSISPMEFVQRYLDSNAVIVDSHNQNSSETEVIESPPNDIEYHAPVLIDISGGSSLGHATGIELELSGDEVGFVNNSAYLKATIDPNDFGSMAPNKVIEVKSSNGSVSQSSLKREDFNPEGEAEITVVSPRVGVVSVQVGQANHEINFIDTANEITAFKIETENKAYWTGEEKWLEITALNSDGNKNPIVGFTGQIEMKALEGQAEFTPAFLDDQDFVNGVARVKMTATGEGDLNIEADADGINGSIELAHRASGSEFTDLNSSHPNYVAINYLKNQGVLNGNPDGSIEPDQVLKRVEALKMAMEFSNVKASSDTQVSYTDINPNAWYIPALKAATELQIIEGNPDGTVEPGREVKTVEFLKIMLEAEEVDTQVVLTENPIKNLNLNSWYAPYALKAVQMDLIELENGGFDASETVTKGEAAQMLYELANQ